MKQQRNVERGEHEAAGQIFSEDGEGAAASDHNQKQDSFLRHVSVFGAGGATLIAIFGLMGYVPGLGLLGSVREGYIPMAPSTAVSFIVLGCIVPAMTLRSPPGAILILFGVLAATVSLFGMLEVAGHFTGMDLNFEDALVPAAGHLGEIPIARMSPSTGAGFFLAGLAVFPLTLRNTVRTSRGHLEHWVGCLGSLVLAISIAFCLAYLYGTPLLYGRGATVPMALTTALGFLMLGIAAICASGRDAIPLRVLIDPSIRGYLLRLFLPLTIVSTVLGGLVVHRVTILSDVNPALVATTTAVLTASITGLITIWIARHVAAVIARSKAVRDQAMASMRESEERLSSFLDNSAVVAWMKDEDGRHVFLSDNYQKRFQVEFNDWEGKTDFELWPRETAEEFRRNDLEVLRKGESIEVVERTTNRDGGVSWWLNNKFMFQDQSGKRYVGGLGVDITERKQAEEERLSLERQVLHAQKLEGLGVLAGGIAHDFNNLLTAILGNTDLALMDLSQVSPVRGNLLEVKKTSQRAAELARQMLAYSGKGKFVIELLDMSHVVEEMGRILEVSASKKAVLKYNFSDNLPPFEGDATQVRQVIMNLITNASEAIGDRSGTISVTVGAIQADRDYLGTTYIDEHLPEGLYITLEVADTGCGMNAEIRSRLFDPFFTTKFTGRGLGMAAVMGIVRGHNGAIKIYSEENKGTTMTVLFPAAEGKAVETAEPAETAALWRGSGTVLLVDDEESVRTIGTMMLERLDMTVISARDGRQAVDVFTKRRDEIDCVILDLTMPHMDGEQAYRELRRIDPQVRVIMSSGYNEQDVTQRFVGKGLAGFIQKPYEFDTLAAILRNTLDA